jgi:hypothetical protein
VLQPKLAGDEQPDQLADADAGLQRPDLVVPARFGLHLDDQHGRNSAGACHA